MKKVVLTGMGLLSILLITSCSPAVPEEMEIEQVKNLSMEKKKSDQEVIKIMEQDLYPEGIEYDLRNNKFLISSITKGIIGEVVDGEYREFITDNDLVSSVGIHIDHSGKRILVANSDLGVSERTSEAGPGALAALAVYDLEGNRLFYANLGNLAAGPHFANDVTVDNKGNAYVTDSFSGIIYKVDPQGNGSIFYQNDIFIPAPGSFGLNGIDYDPRGFLLVSNLDDNQILRFPINNPANYSVVNLPVELNRPDGLYLKNPNELLVVNNALGGEDAKVQTFRTKDKWQSAQLVNEFNTTAVFPTTVTVKRNTPYVLYAHLDVLLSGGSQSTFSIVKVE